MIQKMLPIGIAGDITNKPITFNGVIYNAEYGDIIQNQLVDITGGWASYDYKSYSTYKPVAPALTANGINLYSGASQDCTVATINNILLDDFTKINVTYKSVDSNDTKAIISIGIIDENGTVTILASSSNDGNNKTQTLSADISGYSKGRICITNYNGRQGQILKAWVSI